MGRSSGPKEICIRSWESISLVGIGNFEGGRTAHCKVYGQSAVNCGKTAEPIEMPFEIWTRLGARKYVLNGSAHRSHLANTIEPPMCGGDAVCCQITLTSC